MNDFLNIVITSPKILEGEAGLIQYLLDYGVDYVHIRKPDFSLKVVEEIIRAIPDSYHPRLKLHSHFELMEKYKLGGVHLNSRNPEPPKISGKISRSCHSLEELDRPGNIEYQFLSPIFDSITKKDYRGRFDIDNLTSYIYNKKVIALGGVTPERFELLRKTGFRGGALLGYIWQRFH